MARETTTLPRRRGVIRIYLESRLFGPIAFLMGAPAVVFGLVLLVVGSPVVPRVGGVIAILFGGLLALGGIGSITGIRFLVADVAGNALHFRDGSGITTTALDELVIPTITSYPRRRVGLWYRLETPSLPGIVILDHYKRPLLEKLVVRLEQLRAQARVRGVLAAAPLEDAGAFRSQPELRQQLEQVVPDDALRTSAIAALAKDPDADIARRATSSL